MYRFLMTATAIVFAAGLAAAASAHAEPPVHGPGKIGKPHIVTNGPTAPRIACSPVYKYLELPGGVRKKQVVGCTRGPGAGIVQPS